MLVCGIVLVDTMLYAALVPLLPEFATEYGLSKAGSGLLVASFAAGALLAAIPSGLAAAHLGPKRTILAGLVIMSLASGLQGAPGRSESAASFRASGARCPGPEASRGSSP
jgi:MFS family permease